MRKLLAVLGIIGLASLHVVPANATNTRSQLLSFFSGATGTASASNCWPTNGVGSITGATMRACMVEFLNAVPWIYGDVTSVAAVGVATPYNWNWPVTAGNNGECLTSAGGGSGTMTWGACSGGSISWATNSDVWTAVSHTAIDGHVAQTSIAPVALTIATSTFTPNFANGINEDITLVHASCPCTIANPSNAYAGLSGFLTIIQSSTGSDTVTWGGNWKFSGGVAPTLSTAANAVDILPFYCRTSSFCAVTFTGNVH